MCADYYGRVNSVQVDIQAIDHADAFHDAMFVAAILAPHPFYLEGVALVQHAVVEYKAGIPAATDEVCD